MADSRLWIGWIGADNSGARRQPPRPAAAADPSLRPLLDRHDDRLLRDAGLTREEVLGPSGSFWRAWARRPRHPML